MPSLIHAGVLAGITWDPFIRGLVILVLFIVLLPGSVYLVLSTNTGIRVGLLLILAGATGMLALIATLWMPLASSADIGRPNSWKPLEVITGNYANQVTVKGTRSFPADNVHSAKAPLQPLPKKHWFWPFQSCKDSGWHQIDPSLINDPESAADKVLAPAATSSGPTPPSLTTPFSASTDYVYVDGYQSGQNGGCLFSINRHKVYLPFARGPHFVVLRVLPALPTANTGGVTKVQPDTSKPYTYVILERNLGSVRQPQFLLALSSGMIFLVLCYILHVRDKEIERQDRAEGEPSRDRVGASV